mgnify:CR=1 FL=1
MLRLDLFIGKVFRKLQGRIQSDTLHLSLHILRMHSLLHTYPDDNEDIERYAPLTDDSLQIFAKRDVFEYFIHISNQVQ